MKKTITIVTGPMAGHGGEETVVTKFINEFSGKIDFNLYISQIIGDTTWIQQLDSNTRVTIGTASTNRLVKAAQLLNYMCQCRSDAVIVFTPRLLFLVNLAKKITLRRYRVISWIQFSIDNYFSKRDKSYFKLADDHLAISTGIQQQLSALGIDDKKIHLIYNPVSKSKQVIVPDMNQVDFVYIARIQFEKQKNMRALFDACSQLTGLWRLHIYGADTTFAQSEYHTCVDYIRRLGIESHIVWHGWIADVWSKIEHADALVLTSTFEGFGMVLAEGISRGIPAISFDCPVGPADIINKYNGFLINNGDVTQFATAMQKFVDRKVYFSATHVKKSITTLYEDVYYPRTAELLNKLL
ncbi:glycosyltransferase (plasmid) [Lactiplantibacillus plantarum]